MIIELAQLYNNNLYYKITYKDGKQAYSLGYEQTRKLIEEAKARGEKIEIRGIQKLVEEHNKLIKFIKSENKRRK